MSDLITDNVLQQLDSLAFTLAGNPGADLVLNGSRTPPVELWILAGKLIGMGFQKEAKLAASIATGRWVGRSYQADDGVIDNVIPIFPGRPRELHGAVEFQSDTQDRVDVARDLLFSILDAPTLEQARILTAQAIGALDGGVPA